MNKIPTTNKCLKHQLGIQSIIYIYWVNHLMTNQFSKNMEYAMVIRFFYKYGKKSLKSNTYII